MATKFNIEVMCENTQNITLTINPMQVDAGDTIFFTVKPDYDDDQDDSSALIRKDLVGTPGHTITILLAAEDIAIPAGKYVYDIKISKSGSQSTLAYGKFVVKDAVTLRGT